MAASKKVGGKKGKSSAYQKYMKTQLQKLKEEEPDMTHQERFAKAAKDWSAQKEGGGEKTTTTKKPKAKKAETKKNDDVEED